MDYRLTLLADKFTTKLW